VRKVLITGGAGQLGSDVRYELSEKVDTVSVDIPDFDITDLEATVRYLRSVGPSDVVHCAALTDVDACESHQDQAYAVNSIGTRNVAIATRKVGARFIYISTDYVFEGTQPVPYVEFDEPNPRTVYGKSKLMGERYVQQQLHEYFIVRIAWLYGRAGRNFVKTILRLARGSEPLRVVNDQYGTPTWTIDVVRQLQHLLETETYGTYHATSQGSCSWYDFARAILEEAGIDAPIVPVATEEFPRPAPRPRNSVLDNYLLRLQGMDLMPPWRESLSEFMAQTRCEEEGGHIR
jgi:dTDP-4-dehydrorhamnose reductase